MSRLIVKNLPKKFAEEKLRNIFQKFGTITDIQLKFTQAGKFRQLAFVGYQKDDQAQEAIKELNNTFVQTNKISVETCAPLGHDSKPKAWSKYAPDSNAYKSKNKPEKAVDKDVAADETKKTKKKKKKSTDESLELLKKYKDDPMFEEFLQVNNHGNEIAKLRRLSTDSNKEIGEKNDEAKVEEKLAEKPITDAEYMEQLMNRKPREKMQKKVKEKVDFFTIKLKGLPYSVKKKDIKEFFRPLKLSSIRIPPKIHSIAYVGFKNEQRFQKALEKNKSFMKGKQVFLSKFDNKILDSANQVDPKRSKWISEEESLKNVENIAESGRIFVRNLSYTCPKDELETLFSKYGPLTEVLMPVDVVTKVLKGFAMITFMLPEHATKAYMELDGTILQGRMLHLLPGKEKDNREDETDDATTNFKKKKAAKQKAESKSSHNWNSLFLSHNAVAQVLADTHQLDKEAVIGPDSHGNAAVRLALGETQIVADTRKYLEEQGVVLDVFNAAPTKRSKTVILVKNLPPYTDINDMREAFGKYGEIGRIILPPHGITAVIEFFDPTEAKKAFTSLAYTFFKSMPLYLEWAPENSLQEKPKVLTDDSKVQKNLEENSSTESNKVETEEQQEVEDEEPEADTTIFVKNLNFGTTQEDFRKHFERCGKIHYASIVTRKDKNNPAQILSNGYGFVQFYVKASADKSLKTLQQSVLDGKSLELQRSDRNIQQSNSSKPSKKAKATKQNGPKLLVRNVPFQAKKTELYELFNSFGMIKTLRLPKKMSLNAEATHRGFAFVEYATNEQAKEAFDALAHSTHLYGRRLVLEWAAEDEDVETLRKRTADHFNGGRQQVKSKKSILTLD